MGTNVALQRVPLETRSGDSEACPELCRSPTWRLADTKCAARRISAGLASADDPRMSLKRVALAVATVWSTAALIPSLAEAADFCVPNPNCSPGGIQYLTLQGALAATELNPTSDRIFLAPGIYIASTTGGFNAPLYPVQIIGSGRDSTTILAPTNASPVLGLGNPASSVDDAQIVAPARLDALPKTVLSLGGGNATRVSITPDIGAGAGTTGVHLGGGVLTDSSVTLPTNASNDGIVASTDSRISNVKVTAANGIDVDGADVQIDRTRVTAAVMAIRTSRMNTRITDSLIDVTGPSGSGIRAMDQGGSNVTVTARNVTINGRGGASYGVIVGSTLGGTVTAIVDSSVVRGATYAFYRSAVAPGAANIGVSYSDYDPPAVWSPGGNGVFGTGAGNVGADPRFTGPLDFHPLAGSPVIDSGDPGSFNDTLDLDGNPRVVGGRRDMGAFEAPLPPA